MTLGAVLAVCWPLARRQGDVRSGTDIAVYGDQLDEIGRDQATGLIGNAEAEAARVEVSRRMIAAAETAKAAAAVTAPAQLGSTDGRHLQQLSGCFRSLQASRISRSARQISFPFR